jgi:hypothetical protein
MFVEKFMLDINRKVFDYIRYRMSQNFLQSWYKIFCHCAGVLYPLLLIICEVQRNITFHYQPMSEYDFSTL